MDAAGLIGVDGFVFKTISHSGLAPSSIEVGSFQGIMLYRRIYATNDLTVVAVDTGRSSKVFLAGRNDFMSDLVFSGGKLYMEGSGTYWGGIFLTIVGSKI